MRSEEEDWSRVPKVCFGYEVLNVCIVSKISERTEYVFLVPVNGRNRRNIVLVTNSISQ